HLGVEPTDHASVGARQELVTSAERLDPISEFAELLLRELTQPRVARHVRAARGCRATRRTPSATRAPPRYRCGAASRDLDAVVARHPTRVASVAVRISNTTWLTRPIPQGLFVRAMRSSPENRGRTRRAD